MKKSRKSLVLLLFVAVLSLAMQMSAFAAKPAAKIGKKSYATLDKAVKSVKKGQTITLQKNVTYSENLVLNRKVKYTINLNNKKLKAKGLVVSKGTVTIKNGSIQLNTYYPDGDISGNGKLTLSKAKVKSNMYMYLHAKDLTLNNCTFSDKEIWNYSTKCTINGGKYNQFRNMGEGRVIINKGSFTGLDNGSAFSYDASKRYMEVNNAKIISTSKNQYDAISQINGTLVLNKVTAKAVQEVVGITYGKVTINGGKFSSGAGWWRVIHNYGADMTVKGGALFNGKPIQAYVNAEGKFN